MVSSDSVLQNRYRIIRQLGKGGMGVVYEALDQRVNCLVALKETLAINESEARRAFEREASLLANLRHPLLPKVMDYFSEAEADYLVMEFISGYDLLELLELRGSPFPQPQVLRWADDLLKVLEYLHGQNPPILHRDIKPSNMKLTRQGEIFLLDFGLAKGAAGQMPTMQTSRSVRGYTPVYASLEQIHGQGTDPRSDLYSLGATLYHLLAGAVPIDAPTRFHFIDDEKPDPLKQIVELNPQASPGVAAVIHQAMAVNRRNRPVNAAEMRRALRNGAEEDERRLGEEEYVRAEAKRQKREEDLRIGAEEAERDVAEERARQEAETRKLEEERRHEEAKHRQRADEAARQAEVDLRRKNGAEPQRSEAEEKYARRNAEEAARARDQEAARRLREAIPETVLSPPTSARDGAGTAEAKPKPEFRTIPAPAPERFTGRQQSPATMFGNDPGTATDGRGKRALAIGGGIVAIIFVAAVVTVAVLVFSLIRGTGTSNVNQPETQSPSQAGAPGKPGNNPVVHNQIGMDLVYLPPGTFAMGSDVHDGSDEKPVHQVTISRGFYMGRFEVTQGQWQRVMGTTLRQQRDKAGSSLSIKGEGDSYPIYYVSWDEAQEFCRKLSELESGNGLVYRLPTEAEWEYACRAGATGDYAGDLDEMAWYSSNSGATAHPVGQKRVNMDGLYDMHGNVWEWCGDWYHPNYDGAPTDGSEWLSGGEQKYRVLRGGSWNLNATNLRSACRYYSPPEIRSNDIGFRVAAVR